MMRVLISATYNKQKRVPPTTAGTLFYLPDSIAHTTT